MIMVALKKTTSTIAKAEAEDLSVLMLVIETYIFHGYCYGNSNFLMLVVNEDEWLNTIKVNELHVPH